MLNKPDILCFSSSDWHGKWGSRQQVMIQLANRGYRVLFVERLAGLEHFVKYKDLRQRRLKQWRKGLTEIRANIWLVSPPILPPGRYYSVGIARLNAFIVRQWLQPYLKHFNFLAPILWLYQPEHTFFIGKMRECCTVYHCIDEFTVGTRGRKKNIITKLEQALLRQAEIVFANSLLTYQNKKVFNPHTYRIPSGADVAHFGQVLDHEPIHPNIAALPQPRIGFIGNINEKIDILLLAKIAQAYSTWSLVMIGQTHPYAVDLTPLQTQANVYWLGKRPFQQLPALLRGIDVCILPYVQGEATRYRSPLKLYEYLATGKPVLSTPHPEVNEFKDVITIALGDSFVEALPHILDNDTDDRRSHRIQTAQQHSWSRRVDEIEKILQHKANCYE